MFTFHESLHSRIVQASEFFRAAEQCKMLLKLKDNKETAAEISHDLKRNNELALSSTRNLQLSFCISEKAIFYHRLTLVT